MNEELENKIKDFTEIRKGFLNSLKDVCEFVETNYKDTPDETIKTNFSNILNDLLLDVDLIMNNINKIQSKIEGVEVYKDLDKIKINEEFLKLEKEAENILEESKKNIKPENIDDNISENECEGLDSVGSFSDDTDYGIENIPDLDEDKDNLQNEELKNSENYNDNSDDYKSDSDNSEDDNSDDDNSEDESNNDDNSVSEDDDDDSGNNSGNENDTENDNDNDTDTDNENGEEVKSEESDIESNDGNSSDDFDEDSVEDLSLE